MAPALTTAEKFGLYGKAFSGAMVSGLMAYSTAQGDGAGVSSGEWIGIVLSALGSFGIIWAVPNTPKVAAKYGKLVFAGLAAGGSSLIVGLTDGSLSQVEVISAVIAFGLASGLTGAVSNAAASDPVDASGTVVAIPGAVKDAMVVSTTLVVREGNHVALVDDEDMPEGLRIFPNVPE